MQIRDMKFCILLVMSFLLIVLSVSACTTAPSPATTSLTKAPTTTEQTISGWDAAKVLADLAKIPDDYSSEQALQDGCYLFGTIKDYPNQVAIDFIQKTAAGKNASLRMVGITVEGDPIITQIDFVDLTFHVLYDTSRDNFGNYGIQEFSYLYLKTYEDSGQIIRYLVNDQTLTLEQITKLNEFAVFWLPFTFE